MIHARKKPNPRVEDYLHNQKVVDVLVQRLKARHTTLGEGTIRSRVSQFVAHNALTEQSLRTLDREIRSPSFLTPGAVLSSSCAPSPTPSLNPVSRPVPAERLRRKQPAKKYNVQLAEEEEWCKIVKFNTKLHEEALRQRTVKKQKEHAMLRRELLRQMEEKQVAKARDAAEVESFVNLQQRGVRAQEERERSEDSERRSLVFRQRADLELQLGEKRRQERIAKALELRAEKRYLEQCRRERERAEEIKLSGRKQAYQNMLQLVRSSEEQRRRLKTDAFQGCLQDRLDLDMYMQHLDHEDAEKSARRSAQTAVTPQATQTALHVRNTRIAREEQYYARQADEAFAKYRRDQSDHTERIRSLRTAMRTFYDAQVDQKRRNAAAEREAEKLQARTQAEEEAREMDERETKIAEAKRRECERHAGLLRRQIEERSRMKGCRTVAYFYPRRCMLTPGDAK